MARRSLARKEEKIRRTKELITRGCSNTQIQQLAFWAHEDVNGNPYQDGLAGTPIYKNHAMVCKGVKEVVKHWRDTDPGWHNRAFFTRTATIDLYNQWIATLHVAIARLDIIDDPSGYAACVRVLKEIIAEHERLSSMPMPEELYKQRKKDKEARTLDGTRKEIPLVRLKNVVNHATNERGK